MRLQSLVILLVVLFVFVASRVQSLQPGGWSSIKIDDPHVIEIANFAVDEYDKQSGSKLKFEKVINGESQVVAGINYRLTLSATDGSTSKHYETVVWEKSWEHLKNLTSFKPVNV